MDVVEFTPDRERYAYTFGGAAPVMTVEPGTALRLWSDDAFCGALRSADDSSEKVDLRFVNPQTGPFTSTALSLGTRWCCTSCRWSRRATGGPRRPYRSSGHDGDRSRCHTSGSAARHHVDLRARPRSQHRGLCRQAQRPPHRAAHRTDARHGGSGTGRRRGQILLVPDRFGGNMDTPQMRSGATVFLGVMSKAPCSRSGTATTGRARARPAEQRSKGR